jgi:AraC-like DNA-binding protein
MIARRYKPMAPLDQFVDCLWYVHGFQSSHSRERALPTGTVELVFNLAEDQIKVCGDENDFEGQQFKGAVICGAQSSYFVLDPRQQNSVVGIHFRPGGAPAFLGAPGGEFSDRHVGLEDVWGPSRARELRARLIEATSPEAMFSLLEAALLARLRRPLLMNPAIAHALGQITAQPALSRIGQISDEAGYSAKRFIALFRDSVGLTPKVFCRIRRFQTVIHQINAGDRVDWAGVALDSGFYDQSHLNREFRAFTGLTPSEYRPLADRPNHVAIES